MTTQIYLYIGLIAKFQKLQPKLLKFQEYTCFLPKENKFFITPKVLKFSEVLVLNFLQTGS